MTVRLFIIFLPLLIGLMLLDPPELSIVWSLAGSVFIAGIVQTNWFTESAQDESVTRRLLRPGSMFHLMFVVFHIIGGAFHALNGAGHSFFGTRVPDPTYDPFVLSYCQRLMLLSHASVTAGMKLVGLHYGFPCYRVRSIPSYCLTMISLITLGISTAIASVPGFQYFASNLAGVSTTSVLVEIFTCVWYRRHKNLVVALVLFGMNLYSQAVSGWKGTVLFTMITLGALLYHLMPKVVILGGAAFLLVWALYFYPFARTLRPLLWYQGLPLDAAIEISIAQTLNLSLEQRLNIIWSSFSERVSDLTQFRKYVEYVPKVRPYYGFDIVAGSVVALVPRVFWPEKPNMEALSMQRVYEAGIASKRSRISAKSNFYQDAYLSGGEVAIVLACVSLGMFMISINRLCERLFGGYDIGTCLVYTSLFATPLHVTQNFEYLLGAMAMSILVVCAIFVVGRSTGWIVSAGKLNHGLQEQARISHAVRSVPIGSVNGC